MADSVLVVTSGLTIITNALLNPGGAGAAVAPKWVQWGVGTTPPATGNTDLETKTDCDEGRENVTATVETDALADDTFQVTALLTKDPATSAAITEVATFNLEDDSAPAAGGTMFLRATFSAINLVAGNSIDFTIDTKFVPV